MKRIYQILAISFVSMFVFSACGEEDIVKNTEKENYTLTYKIDYKGSSEIKQVRAGLFDYETSVQNEIPTAPPASALSFPTEALTTGGVNFSKEVEIKLSAIKGKKYLVVIYGDVDPTDGETSVHTIDPVYQKTNFTPTKNEVFNIELKDQECTPDCSGGKICGDDGCNGVCGTCETGKTCSSDQLTCEDSCIPDCSGDKICGDDGCNGVCGTCETGKTCSSDQLTCEGTTKSYEMNITVNYAGTKEIKRIGIAGYDNDSYSGMPKYAHFIDGPITFPYTFTLDPTKEGTFKLSSDYNGNFYIWLYGDVDGTGFEPTNADPQVKFMVVLPDNNITKNVEILDIAQ